MRRLQLKYLFVYTTPLVILFSLWAGNIWSFFALFFIFGLIPFIELFTKGSTYNLNPQEEEEVKNNFMFDLIIYLLVPLQYIILIYFLFQVSDETLPLYEKIGMTTAYGLACGGIGINGAHELGLGSLLFPLDCTSSGKVGFLSLYNKRVFCSIC